VIAISVPLVNIMYVSNTEYLSATSSLPA